MPARRRSSSASRQRSRRAGRADRGVKCVLQIHTSGRAGTRGTEAPNAIAFAESRRRRPAVGNALAREAMFGYGVDEAVGQRWSRSPGALRVWHWNRLQQHHGDCVTWYARQVLVVPATQAGRGNLDLGGVRTVAVLHELFGRALAAITANLPPTPCALAGGAHAQEAAGRPRKGEVVRRLMRLGELRLNPAREDRWCPRKKRWGTSCGVCVRRTSSRRHQLLMLIVAQLEIVERPKGPDESGP